MDSDRARTLLTAELRELDHRAEFVDRARADVVPGDLGNEGGLGQHPGDYGTDVTNRMEAQQLAETVHAQRRRVQDALHRLDEGRYGRCSVCDRLIDDERLESRPETATCREHADAHAAPM